MHDLLRVWRRVEELTVAAGVDAHWQELLGDDLHVVQPFLKPEQQLATTYPCPHPVHDECPRRVVHHGPGEIVAVCGNASPQCEPLAIKRSDLVVRSLKTSEWTAAVVRALREANGLESLDLDVPEGVVALGLLVRRGKRLAVVWAREGAADIENLARGIRASTSGTDLVLVLPPGARGGTDRPVANAGIVLLTAPAGDGGRLELHRALDLLDPSYRAGRVDSPTAIFDEVVLEFAEEPGTRHVVRINGQDFGGFQKSDLKFLRLLMLAAARRGDGDVDGGGWLDKFKLQGDEKDHDLEAVREELRKYDHPALNSDERAALVKRSPSRDSKVRLAVAPTSIVFHESLASFQLIGEQQTQARSNPKKGRTSGQTQRAANFAKRDQVAKKLLAEARKLGVPGPAATTRRGE
jgi:hypothetical protein